MFPGPGNRFDLNPSARSVVILSQITITPETIGTFNHYHIIGKKQENRGTWRRKENDNLFNEKEVPIIHSSETSLASKDIVVEAVSIYFLSWPRDHRRC